MPYVCSRLNKQNIRNAREMSAILYKSLDLVEHAQASEESVHTSITQTILCWCEIRKVININTKYLWNVTLVLIFTAFFRKILLNLTTRISRVTCCFHNHVLCKSTVVLLLGHPSIHLTYQHISFP